MPIAMPGRAAAAVMLALSALSAPAAPLTFEEALRLAQERSRQLPAQDAAATASRQMAIAAGRRPDPTLRAGLTNLPVNGPDRFSVTADSMTMRSIGVMQELTRESKRRALSARHERDAESAEAARALALSNLRRDTAVAWLERFFRERMLDVVSAQRDEARLQIEGADAAYRAGQGSQSDVFAARLAVAQIEQRILQAQLQVQTSRTALSRWVGAAASEPLAPAPAMENVAEHLGNLESRLEQHPEIAVLLRQEAAARADVDIARANRRSDWSVELMYSQRGPAYSDMISLDISVPLQWDQRNRQDREVAAKLATVEQLRAQREEETRMHLSEVVTMLQEWHSGRLRLQRYERSVLSLASERTSAAIAAYRSNTGSLDAVLEARRSEIDVRLERLQLEMETALLWARLNYLLPNDHASTEYPR